MRTLSIALIGWLPAWAAQAQAPGCAPVPGVEALWAKPETRFVLSASFTAPLRFQRCSAT